MIQPLIFIATNTLKPGALEAERQRVPELSDFLKASEPRLIAFNEYVNDAGDDALEGVVRLGSVTGSRIDGAWPFC